MMNRFLAVLAVLLVPGAVIAFLVYAVVRLCKGEKAK